MPHVRPCSHISLFTPLRASRVSPEFLLNCCWKAVLGFGVPSVLLWELTFVTPFLEYYLNFFFLTLKENIPPDEGMVMTVASRNRPYGTQKTYIGFQPQLRSI